MIKKGGLEMGKFGVGLVGVLGSSLQTRTWLREG